MNLKDTHRLSGNSHILLDIQPTLSFCLTFTARIIIPGSLEGRYIRLEGLLVGESLHTAQIILNLLPRLASLLVIPSGILSIH
jgi:hypothetical protein